MRLAKFIFPEGDKILVLPEVPATKTDSGILLDPNPKGKKTQMGRVIAVSQYLNTVWQHTFDQRALVTAFMPAEQKVNGITVDDDVLFAEYAGDDLKIKDLDTGDMVLVKLLPVESILARVEARDDLAVSDAKLATTSSSTPSA